MCRMPPRGTGHTGPSAARGCPSLRNVVAWAARTKKEMVPTSVSLFDQGLVQVLEAAVSGSTLKKPYILALIKRAIRHRYFGAPVNLHDKPRRLGRRQCDRANSPDGAG